jgi:4-oxalomesaconate tautomerase
MIIERDDGIHSDFNSTLAQLSSEKSSIDWSVNCGNMSAAIPLFLLNNAQLCIADPVTTVRIRNTNTGVIMDCSLPTPCFHPELLLDAEIPGVSILLPSLHNCNIFSGSCILP